MRRLKSKYCSICKRHSLHIGRPTKHLFHLVTAIMTIGLWIPIWLFLTIRRIFQYQCVECINRLNDLPKINAQEIYFQEEINRTKRNALVKTGLLFALIGPFFLGLFYLLPFFSALSISQPESFLGLFSMIYLSPFASYPIGLLPAFASGIIYGLFLHRHLSAQQPHLIIRLLVGAIAGLVVGIAFAQLLSGRELLDNLNLAWNLMGKPSAFAGCVCALIIQGQLYQWIIQASPRKQSK